MGLTANVIILHGDGLVAMSQKIEQVKKDFDPVSVTYLSGKESGLEEALVQTSTPGLFVQKRLAILEDFEADKIDLQRLPLDKDLTILIKISKQLIKTSKILKLAEAIKAQVFLFKEQDEKNIFPFLDALAEKRKEAFSLFEKNFGQYGSQYLLTMIFYMLRKLVLTPKNLPLFVLQKIEKQKSNFAVEKVKEIYLMALKTDFKIKSGLIDEKTGLTLLVERILTI